MQAEKNGRQETDPEEQFGPAGMFGDTLFSAGPGKKKDGPQTARGTEQDDVRFDEKTGKLVIQQRKVERQTGLKRSLDAFESEKIDRMIESAKVA